MPDFYFLSLFEKPLETNIASLFLFLLQKNSQLIITPTMQIAISVTSRAMYITSFASSTCGILSTKKYSAPKNTITDSSNENSFISFHFKNKQA